MLTRKILVVDVAELMSVYKGIASKVAGIGNLSFQNTESTHEALERFRQEGFDFVFSGYKRDCPPPLNTGLDLLREIAPELNSTDFYLVTVLKDVDLTREAIKAGAKGVIYKNYYELQRVLPTILQEKYSQDSHQA